MLLLKNRNLVLLGALGLFIYYITKNSIKNSSAEKPAEDEGDTDLTDVMNGNEPSSQSEGDFTKADLTDKSRPIKLESKSLGITLTYQPPYRGGARPTQEMMERRNAWTVSGITDVIKLKQLGLNVKIPKLGIGKSSRKLSPIAQTNDVIDFVFKNKENWSAKFGKPQIKDRFTNLPVPSIGKSVIRKDRSRVPSVSEGNKEFGLIMRSS